MVSLNGGIKPFIEQVRSLAFGANIPSHLWAETISTSNYSINLFPIRANGGLTPHQQLFGVLPNFHHLKVFGCLSFVFISAHKAKWSRKSLHFVLIGYDSTSKGYHCFLLEKNKSLCLKMLFFMKITSISHQLL